MQFGKIGFVVRHSRGNLAIFRPDAVEKLPDLARIGDLGLGDRPARDAPVTRENKEIAGFGKELPLGCLDPPGFVIQRDLLAYCVGERHTARVAPERLVALR